MSQSHSCCTGYLLLIGNFCWIIIVAWIVNLFVTEDHQLHRQEGQLYGVFVCIFTYFLCSSISWIWSSFVSRYPSVRCFIIVSLSQHNISQHLYRGSLYELDGGLVVEKLWQRTNNLKHWSIKTITCGIETALHLASTFPAE